MRCVVQRVRSARVSVADRDIAAIGVGLLALIGVERGDGLDDVSYVATKLASMRIFPDAARSGDVRMRQSVQEVGASLLLVSQFTLLADLRRGRRPSFDAAAQPAIALERFDQVVAHVRGLGLEVSTGQFGAMMVVTLQNDGPVTLLIDSRLT